MENKAWKEIFNRNDYNNDQLMELTWGENVYNEHDELVLTYITNKVNNYEIEDQYANCEVVFKRESDDKYFKMFYTKTYDGTEIDEQLIEQVYPEQITITVYE